MSKIHRPIVSITQRLTDRRVITIDEAKEHCEISHGDDDKRILRLIDTATRHIEKTTELIALDSNLRVQYQHWPTPFELPRWPAVEVTQLEYFDTDDQPQTLTINTDFLFFVREELPAEVCTLDGGAFPALGRRPYPVRLNYRGGFTAANTPPDLVHAVKILVRDWYDNPASVVVGTITTEVKRSLTSLLSGLKPGTVPGGMQ